MIQLRGCDISILAEQVGLKSGAMEIAIRLQSYVCQVENKSSHKRQCNDFEICQGCKVNIKQIGYTYRRLQK